MIFNRFWLNFLGHNDNENPMILQYCYGNHLWMKKVQRISEWKILETKIFNWLRLLWVSQWPCVALQWQAETHFDEERERREGDEAKDITNPEGILSNSEANNY